MSTFMLNDKCLKISIYYLTFESALTCNNVQLPH